ncbi:MAG: aminotransferase class III-fold pyridoxal phosphate-dependent enzyme, partial [Planctomycetota bacterium]
MTMKKLKFVPVKASLEDLTGKAYIESVVQAQSFLTGRRVGELRRLARKKVDFFPAALQKRLDGMLPAVGTRVSSPLRRSAVGASTIKFNEATATAMAPLAGLGVYRLGEDGRLYLASKSEHYHAPLGHSFPGYELIDIARQLGIPNATHNNTRGHITRVMEEEIVRTANGLAIGDAKGLKKALASKSAKTLNRVINLETGSLAVEAALKMMLARFYKAQGDSPDPKYKGKVPVFVVMGDEEGGRQANYHGTTLVAQTLRGMWPEIAKKFEKQGVMKVETVRPNNFEELEAVFKRCEGGKTKIAGFFHELVLMNYGGLRLTEKFVKRIYSLCRKHDVPTCCDEIQSCLWSPELFMFREYGITPTFVAIGKGFPGGEYAASRILFSAAYDTLPQFGALVTNGQEELAAIAYLVTMKWAEANSAVTRCIGEYYTASLEELAVAYPELISRIEGDKHLASIYFREVEPAIQFVKSLTKGGLDVSVQTYKAACPPG